MEHTGILLHACCAPCSSASLEQLLETGYSPTVYFANSNIFPYEEFLKRESYTRELCSSWNIPFISEPWNHAQWLDAVEHRSNDPEGSRRCLLCFTYNLGLAAVKTKSMLLHQFTTTLALSPHKSFPQLMQAGSAYASFMPVDFKKKGGFQRSIELSRKYALYRQRYCGCEYSFKASSSS